MSEGGASGEASALLVSGVHRSVISKGPFKPVSSTTVLPRAYESTKTSACIEALRPASSVWLQESRPHGVAVEADSVWQLASFGSFRFGPPFAIVKAYSVRSLPSR